MCLGSWADLVMKNEMEIWCSTRGSKVSLCSLGECPCLGGKTYSAGRERRLLAVYVMAMLSHFTVLFVSFKSGQCATRALCLQRTVTQTTLCRLQSPSH